MLYINKHAQDIYVELDTLLDADSNQIGTTWDDYLAGMWVLLTSEQEAFHVAHPDATPVECWNMALTPVPDPEPLPEPDALAIARQTKLQEIAARDAFSNKFFVSVTQNGVEVENKELWIDKDTRSTLYGFTLPAWQSDGQTTVKLWTATMPRKSVEVPISWAMKNLPLLEIYAKRTYDHRASNEAAVDAATTVEEIAQIDVKLNYPKFLTFELNLDLGRV